MRLRAVATTRAWNSLNCSTSPRRSASTCSHSAMAERRLARSPAVRRWPASLERALHCDAGLENVGEARPVVLEEEAGVAGDHHRPRCVDARSSTGTAPDGDQLLRLEHAERLAERRPAQAELLRQSSFGGSDSPSRSSPWTICLRNRIVDQLGGLEQTLETVGTRDGGATRTLPTSGCRQELRQRRRPSRAGVAGRLDCIVQHAVLRSTGDTAKSAPAAAPRQARAEPMHAGLVPTTSPRSARRSPRPSQRRPGILTASPAEAAATVERSRSIAPGSARTVPRHRRHARSQHPEGVVDFCLDVVIIVSAPGHADAYAVVWGITLHNDICMPLDCRPGGRRAAAGLVPGDLLRRVDHRRGDDRAGDRLRPRIDVDDRRPRR